MNVNIRNDSRRVIIVFGVSWECDPIRVVAGPNEQFTFTIIGTREFSNLRPGRFLDKDNVELGIWFEYRTSDDWILSNVLRENPKFLYNHWGFAPLTPERMEFNLLSRISAYFLMCHSLWKRCLQKGQVFESAWWLPLQFEHLKEWGHGSPFLVSSLGGLILSLALQHQPNSLWWSDLWGPLHFTHLDPWIRQEKVVCPHFQQFLHWGTPGFMLAPLIVAM